MASPSPAICFCLRLSCLPDSSCCLSLCSSVVWKGYQGSHIFHSLIFSASRVIGALQAQLIIGGLDDGNDWRMLMSSQKTLLIWYKFHWIWQLSVIFCGFAVLLSFILDGVFPSVFHSFYCFFNWLQEEWGEVPLFSHYL